MLNRTLVGADWLQWGWARVDASGPGAAGRWAAEEALARIGTGLRITHLGARPIVIGGRDVTISISHGRRIAVAVAGPVPRLGVDLCELEREPLLRAISRRYFTATERVMSAHHRGAMVAIWAAKEAGLKALGLGLLDSGIFDEPASCPIQIAPLAPPSYFRSNKLDLHLEQRDGAVIALAFRVT